MEGLTTSGAPAFPRVDASAFAALARQYAALKQRRVTEVHLHHTWVPNYSHYRDLKDQLGSGEAAGREQCRRMRLSHMRDRGFSDIAQHVTIDPEGRIWLCRAWIRSPASAVGFNGNSVAGPFMIEMVGDFDQGKDAMSSAQREAALSVVDGMQRAFGLAPSALRFHREMAEKSCPGTTNKKAEWIEELSRRRERGQARGATDGELPLPSNQLESEPADADGLFPALEWVTRSTRSGEAEDGELNEREMSAQEIATLTGGEGASGARGVLGRGPEITTEMIRALRPHAVNLEQGRFSQNGKMTSDPTTVQEIFQKHFRAWSQQQAAEGRPAKLMLFAHGGLVGESQALAQAYATYRWWLENGVYPVFFIWETGPLEIALQGIGRLVGRQRGATRELFTDAAWERVARGPGGALWRGMKGSAERASAEGGGARFVADQLKSLAGDGVELHLVGHSAGAIFHSHLVPLLQQRDLPVRTTHLLAPACTTELYKATILPAVAAGHIDRLRVLTMYRETERKDWTMQKIGYFKSILYAISRSFEPERPTPLLGLEESIRADPALVAHFGLGGAPVAKASVIWSETGKDAPAMLRSNSRTHGFDWEPDSMTAVLLGVLGTGSAAVTPFPKKPERALFDEEADGPWSELDALVQEMGASATPSNLSFEAAPEPATPVVSGGATGSRRALSFAIDAYPTSPLGGCVADQRLWSALLRKRGFELKTYADHECTRSTMLGALNDAVGRTRAGDELVIHYSGHGTHFDDETGDEEDNQDEALVPVDHEASPCIMDDELRELFARLPDGARVTLFMDCCHSGTITRFGVGRPAPGAGRARFIQPTPQMKALYARQRSGRSRAPGGVSAMRHAQFAACLDRQVALEDRGYGRFSLVATRVLEAQQTLSRAELLKAVQRGFREAGYNDQDPMLDAPAALLNDRVF